MGDLADDSRETSVRAGSGRTSRIDETPLNGQILDTPSSGASRATASDAEATVASDGTVLLTAMMTLIRAIGIYSAIDSRRAISTNSKNAANAGQTQRLPTSGSLRFTCGEWPSLLAMTAGAHFRRKRRVEAAVRTRLLR